MSGSMIIIMGDPFKQPGGQLHRLLLLSLNEKSISTRNELNIQDSSQRGYISIGNATEGSKQFRVIELEADLHKVQQTAFLL